MPAKPIILAIDTSLDETSVAVTQGRRVLTNVVFSQIPYHQRYQGVMPSLARRLHQEKLPLVIDKALKNSRLSDKDIDLFAVTQGPGQAIALEVGINKAKELAIKYNRPLVAVNHMVGHFYSVFCQNRQGNPKRPFSFPYLGLVISGGHTQLVLWKDHLVFDLLGETLDDAVGEAYDKAARMLGFGYPGGPAIERLAQKGNPNRYLLPVPLIYKPGLDFSYSGLKTALLYQVKALGKLSRQQVYDLAAAFEQSVIKSLLLKLKRAINETHSQRLVVAGGVASNQTVRQALRQELKGITIHFPALPTVYTDNAAMIGVAAYYYWLKGYKTDPSGLERDPNLTYW